MVRGNWTCLNGGWDYAITDVAAGVPSRWDGKILVCGVCTIPPLSESQMRRKLSG
jgi:hypothetical protein